MQLTTFKTKHDTCRLFLYTLVHDLKFSYQEDDEIVRQILATVQEQLATFYDAQIRGNCTYDREYLGQLKRVIRRAEYAMHLIEDETPEFVQGWMYMHPPSNPIQAIYGYMHEIIMDCIWLVSDIEAEIEAEQPGSKAEFDRERAEWHEIASKPGFRFEIAPELLESIDPID